VLDKKFWKKCMIDLLLCACCAESLASQLEEFSEKKG